MFYTNSCCQRWSDIYLILISPHWEGSEPSKSKKNHGIFVKVLIYDFSLEQKYHLCLLLTLLSIENVEHLCIQYDHYPPSMSLFTIQELLAFINFHCTYYYHIEIFFFVMIRINYQKNSTCIYSFKSVLGLELNILDKQLLIYIIIERILFFFWWSTRIFFFVYSFSYT